MSYMRPCLKNKINERKRNKHRKRYFAFFFFSSVLLGSTYNMPNFGLVTPQECVCHLRPLASLPGRGSMVFRPCLKQHDNISHNLKPRHARCLRVPMSLLVPMISSPPDFPTAAVAFSHWTRERHQPTSPAQLTIFSKNQESPKATEHTLFLASQYENQRVNIIKSSHPPALSFSIESRGFPRLQKLRN